jgi:hypothetical protein
MGDREKEKAGVNKVEKDRSASAGIPHLACYKLFLQFVCCLYHMICRCVGCLVGFCATLHVYSRILGDEEMPDTNEEESNSEGAKVNVTAGITHSNPGT